MGLLCIWGGDNFPVWFGSHTAKGSQATRLSSSAAFPWCLEHLGAPFESGVSGPSRLSIPAGTQADGCREHPALVQGNGAGGMEKPGGAEVVRRVLHRNTAPIPRVSGSL